MNRAIPTNVGNTIDVNWFFISRFSARRSFFSFRLSSRFPPFNCLILELQVKKKSKSKLMCNKSKSALSGICVLWIEPRSDCNRWFSSKVNVGQKLRIFHPHFSVNQNHSISNGFYNSQELRTFNWSVFKYAKCTNRLCGTLITFDPTGHRNHL